MSDDLSWRKKHAILLREPRWAGIAQRENYKIRADLRPLFEAHPAAEDLLHALGGAGLYREGCEFLARMTHRRAAVWWGYCCLLTLFEERKAVEEGKIVRTPDDLELMIKGYAAQLGVQLPDLSDPATMEQAMADPKIDFKAILETPKAPPQDNAAFEAAAAAVGEKASALERLIPNDVSDAWSASYARFADAVKQEAGLTPEALLERACAKAAESPVTYSVNRYDSPQIQGLLKMRELLQAKMEGIKAEIKAAFPEKYPVSPEAARLLKAEDRRISDEAVQAVWRWIVAPDERNTTLALAAGNAAAQLPEGMLAYTAAWSFGDLTPEGKQVIPVPPELPGTGLNSTLLLLALAEGGHRKMAERYELYFNLGLEVVYGRNLWPEAVMEELSPHQQLADESPAAVPAQTSGENAPAYRKWSK